MGQKVNPHSFRLGGLYTWSSNWYAKKGDYSRFLVEDSKLRDWLFEHLKLAGVTEIRIDRSINTVKITLSVARPGVVIGRGGSGLEELKKAISKRLKAPKLELQVVEVKNPDLSARLIGLRLADQLLRRYPHRRAIAQILEKTMALTILNSRRLPKWGTSGLKFGFTREKKSPINLICCSRNVQNTENNSGELWPVTLIPAISWLSVITV